MTLYELQGHFVFFLLELVKMTEKKRNGNTSKSGKTEKTGKSSIVKPLLVAGGLGVTGIAIYQLLKNSGLLEVLKEKLKEQFSETKKNDELHDLTLKVAQLQANQQSQPEPDLTMRSMNSAANSPVSPVAPQVPQQPAQAHPAPVHNINISTQVQPQGNPVILPGNNVGSVQSASSPANLPQQNPQMIPRMPQQRLYPMQNQMNPNLRYPVTGGPSPLPGQKSFFNF